MPRRLRNKESQKKSDSESDDDDVYQQEEDGDESRSPTPSQSPSPSLSPIPSPSPSPSPSSAPCPSLFPGTPFLRRATRSFTLKANKAAATPKTPKIPKTPSTPRTIVTRARVNKKQATARGDQSEIDIESVGDPDPDLPKTPSAKKPRPRTKRVTGGKAQSGGEVETERDVKPVKTSSLKKLGAKPKGHGVGGHPVEDIEPEANTKSAATTPLIASFQGNDVDGDSSLTAPPTKVWSPLDSPMEGIESAAILLTPNRDYEMVPIAVPQQESNCRGKYRRRDTHNALSRSPTVLPEYGHDTARATVMRSVFSFNKEERHTPGLFEPAVPVGQRQTGSSAPDDKHMFSLSVKAESHTPEPLGSGSISAIDTTRLISSQIPSLLITPPRSAGPNLDLCTVQPWRRATIPALMSSMPSLFARVNASSATTTPYTAALAWPETIDDMAKRVDKTYDEASQYLIDAMNLTKRALEDQAHAIRFHTVAFEVFGQGMSMTEPQCQILFPQEHFAFLVASALLASTPLQASLASVVTHLSATPAPQTQTVTSKQDERLLINVVKNMVPELETPLGPSGYRSARARSSSYSSYLPSSRTLSPTSPSPLSTPPRSLMTSPIPIRRHFGERGAVVPWLSSSDFANDSVQPSIFAHNRQGDTTTPPRPPGSMSSSSAQASETIESPCTVTSFGAIMSAANQQYSLHALKRARQKALYEYYQSQRDENGIQSDTQDQQRDSIPSQQQGSPLAMSTFATPRVQQEDFYDKQNNQEVDMGHLKATTEKVEETRAKEEEAEPIRIQVTLSQWSRIKGLCTELYLKAVKSYDDSRDADRVASENHDRFMDASKHWYAMTGQHFPFD